MLRVGVKDRLYQGFCESQIWTRSVNSAEHLLCATWAPGPSSELNSSLPSWSLEARGGWVGGNENRLTKMSQQCWRIAGSLGGTTPYAGGQRMLCRSDLKDVWPTESWPQCHIRITGFVYLVPSMAKGTLQVGLSQGP